MLTDGAPTGWGYVTITGTLSGLQFVNQSGTEYKTEGTIFENFGEAAYYSPTSDKWYKESTKTTEITAPISEISTVKLYFEIPSGNAASDWAVNAWGTGVTVTGNSEVKIRPTTWGEGSTYPTLLTDGAPTGWGYVTITGTLSGLQFVNLSGTEYKTEGAICKEFGDAAYYSPTAEKWYKESTKTTEITASTSALSTVTLYFEIPDGNTASDWAVNAWGTGIVVTGNEEIQFRPTTWGDGSTFPTLLTDGAPDGWGYVKITGDLTGLQFVNKSGTEYKTEGKEYSKDKYYYSPKTREWYESLPENTDLGYKSPEVDGNQVTFRYKSNNEATTKVRLAGSMTDWAGGALALTKGMDGIWTITIELKPGIYEYKFIEGENNWVNDPSNSLFAGSNSKVVVPGLESKVIDVKRGEATALPELKLYDAEGNVTTPTITYALKDASLANVVTIADGKITVAEGTTMDKVVLVATTAGKTSEVTVNVKDFVCEYTVYYYDYNEEHMTTTAADLHVWEDGGANIGDFDFSESEKLSDGRTWLKATFTSAATNIGMIPRSRGEWKWQTGNHFYNNSAQAEKVTLYIVFGDDANTYTTLPEIKDVRKRYVVVEYDRPDGDYEGWNIYAWNNGLTSETEIYTEEKNGKHYITVPVADYSVDLNLGFCMRKSEGTNKWADKDGGDHYINVPADQTVVKAKFVEGEGITEVLPYNTGYVMDGPNDQIHFYYRNDELFKDCTLASLEGKVQLVVNGTSYNMSYDAANERFYYDYKKLTVGDYEYHYVVDGEEVLDIFNSRTTADEKNSVLTYKTHTAKIEASVLNATMDYNDNNVLSVKFTGGDAADIKSDEITSIKADLTALGLGTIDVDPELMEVTIACLYTTSTGEKTIPVTVTDIYGFEYKANATVTVTKRAKADGDFDWDEAVIYFAVTDRFFDGNTSNNTGVDKDGSLSYHGGDFAGLNQKLDYLKDLGVNTIWITPIVENSDTTTDKDGQEIESTGYHGYWASDFTKLNSHLGTEEEFAALIDAAHARNMKIMVDVVINHAGYDTEEHFNTIIKDANGNYISMIRDSSNTVSGSDVYASLAGLPDFVTEDAAVRDQLVKWQTDWMDKFDIDYYRVDTVKHADATTWSAFKNSLTAVNPDFKMTGEYAGAGYASNTGELGTGRMDALLDFDFNGWTADFLTGKISSIESSLVKRNAAINNTATLSSFLNSHDEDGLQSTLQKNYGLSEDEAANLMKVAASLMITAKGQPVIYYGEEIGQYGENNYPYQTNRYDFDWAELTKQQADSTSIYNHYKTMLGIRNTYSELFARGTRNTIAASDEEGYDVFARSFSGTTLYIAMNIMSQAKTLTIPVNGAAGSTYVDLYSGASYTVAADGTVTVSVPAAVDGGTVVLKNTAEAGEVEKESTKSPDGKYEISLGETVEELRDIIFTKTELGRIEAGKDASVYLTIADISKTVTNAEKKLIKNAAKDYTVGTYLDLNLFKVIGDEDPVKITELGGKITVSVAIPDDLINTDSTVKRTYAIVRIHDGVATLIEGTFKEATKELVFKTDAFSTYAIVYKDVPASASANPNTKPTGSPNSGDNTPIAATVMALLLGMTLMAAAVSKKKKITR